MAFDKDNCSHVINDKRNLTSKPMQEKYSSCQTAALENYLDKRDKGFYIFVESDAMIDAGIRKNDLVVANSEQLLENGAIIVAMVNGQLLVRRYFKNAHGEFLSPENVCYPTIEVNKNDCDIRGVVTKVIHSID